MQILLFASAATTPAQRVPCLQQNIHPFHVWYTRLASDRWFRSRFKTDVLQLKHPWRWQNNFAAIQEHDRFKIQDPSYAYYTPVLNSPVLILPTCSHCCTRISAADQDRGHWRHSLQLDPNSPKTQVHNTNNDRTSWNKQLTNVWLVDWLNDKLVFNGTLNNTEKSPCVSICEEGLTWATEDDQQEINKQLGRMYKY